MIKKIFRKIVNRLFLRKIDDIKIQKGQIFEKQLVKDLKNIKDIKETYFKVFSQDTEDGIIQYLLKSLNLNNVKFVEIGTQDYSESNTRYIFETMRCEGLIIDPYPHLKKRINTFLRLWKNKLSIYNDFIDSENILDVLKDYSFKDNIDLFSLDIDGIDFWVLKEIPPGISKIFVVEYNPFFGSKKEITTPNIKKFERYKYHETGFCWGASLKAIINLMNIKGYIFIGSNRLNCNAFFVNKNLISKIGLKIPDTKNLSVYTNAKFQLKGSQDQNKNNEVEVYDIKTKKIKKFLEI